MIPYGKHEISNQDVNAVADVLRSNRLTQGPKVPEFELAMRKTVGSEFSCAFNSATSALHAACFAMELGPGDTLWTSPNTFVASANCALHCGANVDFVDVDPTDFNMCPSALEHKLHNASVNGPLPKILIVVHFAGKSCDMKKIAALSEKYGFKIIEDASHALGGSFDGTLVGNCRYSEVTIFSFHPVKIIASGEGGMAHTNSEELYQRMKRFGSHGITSTLHQMYEMPSDEIWNYQQLDLGFNYRLTDISAALGLSQLSRLDEFIAKRRQIAERYDEMFESSEIIQPQKQHQATLSSYHLYTVRLFQRDFRNTQKGVYERMLEKGIGVNLHYIPVYLQPFYRKLGFRRGLCPESERIYRSILSIPIYTSLTQGEQEYVIKTLKESVNELCI